MLTIKTIQNELNNIPIERLEEVYTLVTSFRRKVKSDQKNQIKNLQFAGIFNDLSENDYNDFISFTRKTRENSFDRNVEL